MCGRYTLKTDRHKLAERFGLDELPEFTPRYNLGPTQDGLVVRTGDGPGTRTAAWLRWGLVPSWIREGAPAPLLINARSETVASKPAFREALKRRRCLVLADGFFEWARRDKVKQPYHLTVNRDEPFAMAGLWERWQPDGAAPEQAIESYTILTTTANEVLASLHDRMPVILEPEFFDDWLNPVLKDAATLQHLLKPFPAVRMVARPVNPRVNNIKYDDPTCLEPAGEVAAAAASGSTSSPRPGRESTGQLDLGLG